MPVGRILARDVGDGLRAELKVFVLDDARVRDFALRVVDDGDTLMILLLQALRLEVQAAVLELAELVIEILVNRARVDDLPGHRLIGGAVFEEVDAGADLNAVEQSLDQLRVAADRDALIAVIEVVVVERIADRQALDDEGWQLCAAAAPLLLRVALDELRVDIRADERDGLLLEVLRLALDGLALLRDDGLRLRWRHDVPELAERIHVERQVVEMALIIRHRRIDEVVECDELIDIRPDILIARVEDVCAVLVDVDAIFFLAVDIAAHMIPALQHQHRLARLLRLMRKDRAKQAAANNQIIVHDNTPLSTKAPVDNHASKLRHEFLQIRFKLAAKIRAAQRKLHGRLEEAQLVAEVIADSFKIISVDWLTMCEYLQRIRQLDFIALARQRMRENIKDRRCDDVPAQ